MEKVFAIPANRSEIKFDKFNMIELLGGIDPTDGELHGTTYTNDGEKMYICANILNIR